MQSLYKSNRRKIICNFSVTQKQAFLLHNRTVCVCVCVHVNKHCICNKFSRLGLETMIELSLGFWLSGVSVFMFTSFEFQFIFIGFVIVVCGVVSFPNASAPPISPFKSMVGAVCTIPEN